MRYLGGKARQAHKVLAALPSGERFIEPFMGGAWVTSAAARSGKYAQIFASDLNASLVLFWNAVMGGWVPPADLDRTEYETLRLGPDSAMRAWAGFAGSFKGKWFGGYGPTATGRDYLKESLMSTLSKRDALLSASVSITCADYTAISSKGCDVVYCDPPYADTTGYGVAFDSTTFWEWAESQAGFVAVSEFSAPDTWVAVDSWQRTSTVSTLDVRPPNTEALFVRRSKVERLSAVAEIHEGTVL